MDMAKIAITISVAFILLLLSGTFVPLKYSFPRASAQPVDQVCANAVFTPPLPKSFINGTSIPFTVNFGTRFNSILEVDATSNYSSSDPFGNGDGYFIDNFGGQETRPGTAEVTSMTLIQLDPSATTHFLNGTYQGKYNDVAGMFMLESLKFCIKGERLLPVYCPANYVQQWDKIVFMITDPNLANRTNLTANTELDIKILDNPHKVADVKQIVLNFLNVPTYPKSSIRILNEDYAVICAASMPTSLTPSSHIAAK